MNSSNDRRDPLLSEMLGKILSAMENSDPNATNNDFKNYRIKLGASQASYYANEIENALTKLKDNSGNELEARRYEVYFLPAIQRLRILQ